MKNNSHHPPSDDNVIHNIDCTAIHRAQTNQQRQQFDNLLHANLLTWSEHFLPKHFHLPPSEMHRWLAHHLDPISLSTTSDIQLPTSDFISAPPLHLNLVGPRCSAKSTVVTLAFVLREALTARQPYIWIVSDTRHQAAAHLENVKAELFENLRLADAYPDAAGEGSVWRSGAIVLRNGVMIEAFGTGQRIRGRRRRHHRPTLIVCDDLQNDGHISSALARDHSRTWFHGLLMKAGTKRTTIINLGTALHHECIAMELQATPGWTSRIFRAIERWPHNMPLWAQWEQLYFDSLKTNLTTSPPHPSTTSPAPSGLQSSAVHHSSFIVHPSSPHSALPTPHSALPTSPARSFYDQNRPTMDAGASLLWPEQEDLYTLMCMRAESGSTAFEREKQSSPVNPELCEWPESYFGDWIWFDTWPSPTPHLILKVLALDPSKGADARRGDYSAFVLLGVARDGQLYLEADLARRPTPQIVSDGIELCRRFRPQAFGIESNQFQELLGADFARELISQGLIGTTPCSIENHVNKAVRIRRLGPLLAAHRLHFKTNSPGTRLLVEQLKEFPISSHDDGPDATEMALRLAESYLQPTPQSDGLGHNLLLRRLSSY